MSFLGYDKHVYCYVFRILQQTLLLSCPLHIEANTFTFVSFIGYDKRVCCCVFYHHHHLFLNREGRWGTKDNFATSFLRFPCPPLPSGTWRTQGLSISWCCLLASLSLSALSSFPFHYALQDGFDQTWWTENMTIPLQCASLYDRQEVFVWSDNLLDLGTDFLFGNMVLVWDV